MGAVIFTKDNRIVSTGYNGSLTGEKHCIEIGCMMEDNHCVRVVHAEMNAILLAAREGISIKGMSLFTTASPCWPCFKGLAMAGIKTVHYSRFYKDPRIFEHAAMQGIEMIGPKE